MANFECLVKKYPAGELQRLIFVDNGDGTFTITTADSNETYPSSAAAISAGSVVKATGVGVPAGADTQVQFNDNGTLAGDADLAWDKTNNLLKLPVAGQLRFGTNRVHYLDGTGFRFFDQNANVNVTFDAQSLSISRIYTLPDSAITFIGIAAGVVSFNANLKLDTAGNGLYVKEGANATMGSAVLVGGTVTVATTKVTANSRIFLTSQVDGGVVGFLRVSARVAGVSFTITSFDPLDTSTVAWLIVEPA